MISPYAGPSSTTVHKTFSDAEAYVKDMLRTREENGCTVSCYFDLINEEEKIKRLYVIKTKTGYETLFIKIDWEVAL
jgi:hypothetical protein